MPPHLLNDSFHKRMSDTVAQDPEFLLLSEMIEEINPDWRQERVME